MRGDGERNPIFGGLSMADFSGRVLVGERDEADPDEIKGWNGFIRRGGGEWEV